MVAAYLDIRQGRTSRQVILFVENIDTRKYVAVFYSLTFDVDEFRP